MACPDTLQRIVTIGRQLRVWSVASIAVGAPLIVFASGGWQALGLQFVVWGSIDLVIALVGLRDAARKKQAGVFDALESCERERRRTARLLWINAGLDVGYVLVGAWLASGDASPVRMGHAIGVLVQGGFLLVFDVVHGVRLRAR